MFFRILKKDLKHKRGINVILFLFMFLATIFVASSVNNILVVTNATQYCMEKGKVASRFISTYEGEGEPSLEDWLDDSDLVEHYSKNEAVILASSNVDDFNNQSGDKFKCAASIMLQSQWKDNMLIFDQAGNEISMKDGEIGIQQSVLDDNGLKIGDTITLKLKDTYMDFKITEAIMDPAFGGDFAGMTRFIISDSDFQKVKDTGMTVNYNYSIDSQDPDNLIKQINKQSFNIITTVDKDMFAYAYVMSLVTAGLLIIVGICLIIIAFLILRFTIVFTLSEDYKEIGIMKAIGIKNHMIRDIYLVKYLVLVSIAAVLGCFISIPVSNAMIGTVSKTMMMENASANFGVNVLCSVLVGIVVLGLCFLCTHRLKKFTAIEAIRSGESGEKFHKASLLSLHRCKRLKAVFFLAVNDILSNVKRYVVLVLTFTIGMLIIILPLNTLSTFSSDEMAKNFMLDTNADFYLDPNIVDDSNNDIASAMDRQTFLNQLLKTQQKLRDKGYDVTLKSTAYYAFSYYGEDKDSAISEMTLVPLVDGTCFVDIIDGTEPVNSNEIAMSEHAMKKVGVQIGDTVHVIINSEVKEFVITGSYQNYMQMGQSAYMNAKVELGDIRTSGCWMYQCYLNSGEYTEDTLEQIRNDFPEITFYTTTEAMQTQLGSTADQMQNLKVVLVALICMINVLITVLMMKIFIMGEKSQIAMLRSIGFSVPVVRLWQMTRFAIVMIISAVLGSVFSIPLNNIALKPIFAMMGASHIKIVPNPLEVYLIYPLLLLVVICAAAYISSGSIKKLKLMDINNQE